MSVKDSDLALHAEVDRFWQSADLRNDTPPGPDEAHTDTPTFAWGVLGVPLVLPQPHYRLFIPSSYYVVGWGLIADAPGTAVVKVEYAHFAAGSGAIAFADVTGGNPPALLGHQAVVAKRLTTWSPNKWAIFDLLHVYLDPLTPPVGVQEITFQLFARRIARVGVQTNVNNSGGGQVVSNAGTPIVLNQG